MKNLQQWERYQVGDLIVDVDAVSVTRDGKALTLTGLTFDLLVTLVRAAPAVVDSETLIAQVWNDLAVSEDTLKQRVRMVRKALDDPARDPVYIETLRGKGYKLIAPVSRMVPPGQVTVAEIAKPKSLLGQWRIPLLGVLVTSLAFFYFWFAEADQKTEAVLSSNPSAVEFYQRAKNYYLRYRAEDNARAITLLLKAIEVDPEFAEAYATLSRAYSQQPKLGNGYFGKAARQAADRAIQLSPKTPDGYLSLGLYYGVEGNLEKSIEIYHQVLDLDPNNAIALANAAYDFEIRGELVKALDYNLRSLKLNPNLYFSTIQVGRILARLEYDHRAEAWFRKALTLQPDNFFAKEAFAYFLISRGRAVEIESFAGDLNAIARRDLVCLALWFQKKETSECLTNLTSDQGLFLDGLIQRDLSERTTTFTTYLKKVDHLEDDWDASTLLDLAAVMALDGQAGRAITLLNQAVDRGWRDRFWLMRHPALETLRSHPDWNPLLTRIQETVATARAEVEARDLLN